MQTLLVRLKPHDARRGNVLRRYTYRGIKFHEERGWYRVDKDVAEYLRTVRQVPGDKHSPLAFDVCTEDEARRLDTKEQEAAAVRKPASDAVDVSSPSADGALTTDALADQSKPAAGEARSNGGRGRRG